MVGRPRLPRWGVLCALLGALWITPASTIAQQETDGPPAAPAAASAPSQIEESSRKSGDILNLDLDQLAQTPIVIPSMDIPVTSVTKELSTVGRSAAAVFVITQEMIRRSGATSIPEALRMAPGVEVMQINANTWSITIRGFSFGSYSNKLLVLIDGRTVYNPDFAGVCWNAQDVLLEDVDRIEVIRGPGGTLWGANAVNGVINIITKEAKATQGTYLMAGGGSQLRDIEAFRYGEQIGENLQYRVYGKHFEQASYYDPTGQGNDSWRQGRFGFRADWQPGRDKSNMITIQGDHFLGSTNNSVIPTSITIGDYLTGDNVLVRWRHIYDDESDWTLQAYFDNYMRQDSLQTQIDKTFDIDFQYRFPLGDRHDITCGAAFRNVQSTMAGGDTFTPWCPFPEWTTNYPSQFIQDEIALIEDRLSFTIGCKLDENPYTGLEYQPSIRLLYAPDRRHSVWGAISRAVHTPTRAEEQISFTGTHFYPAFYQRAIGNPDLVSESVIAYEIGYRAQTTEKLSWDVATFYNVYEDIIATDRVGDFFVEPLPLPPHLVMPTIYSNGLSGQTYGVEFAGNYAVSKTWRLQGQYTVFEMRLDNNPSAYFEKWDPRNQVYLRSSWDLGTDIDFDLMARYVDRLVALGVPSYITLDARLAWRLRKNLELAVVGQNLLDQYHREYFAMGMAYETEVPRAVYGTLSWRY